MSNPIIIVIASSKCWQTLELRIQLHTRPKQFPLLPVLLVLTIHDLGAGPPLVAKVVVVVFVVSALALAVAAVPS